MRTCTYGIEAVDGSWGAEGKSAALGTWADIFKLNFALCAYMQRDPTANIIRSSLARSAQHCHPVVTHSTGWQLLSGPNKQTNKQTIELKKIILMNKWRNASLEHQDGVIEKIFKVMYYYTYKTPAFTKRLRAASRPDLWPWDEPLPPRQHVKWLTSASDKNVFVRLFLRLVIFREALMSFPLDLNQLESHRIRASQLFLLLITRKNTKGGRQRASQVVSTC